MLLLGAVTLLALPTDRVPTHDSAVAAPNDADVEEVDSYHYDGPKFNVKEIAQKQLDLLSSKVGKSKVLNDLQKQNGAQVGGGRTTKVTQNFASGKITCMCKCKIPKSSRGECYQLIKKFNDLTAEEFPAASKYIWFLEKTKGGVPYALTVIEEYASEMACLDHLAHVGDCSQAFLEMCANQFEPRGTLCSAERAPPYTQVSLQVSRLLLRQGNPFCLGCLQQPSTSQRQSASAHG